MGQITGHEPVYVGTDENGYEWYFDAHERRIFCEIDPTPRSERGYDCRSYHRAKEMVKNREVP